MAWRSRAKPMGPSDDPHDKLYACLCYHVGRYRKDDPYFVRVPFYFDACRHWYQSLSAQQKDCVAYVIDTFHHFGEQEGERWAAKLPTAPRYPF